MIRELPLIARFNQYRFDYASLVYDAGQVFLSDRYRAGARLMAIPLFLFLLIPPAVTLVVGLQPFGDVYVFAVMLIAWPWILEKPAWSLRQWRADPVGRPNAEGSPAFDTFIHVFFCLASVSCILLVGFAGGEIETVTPYGEQLLALAWAVALAGSTDLARSLMALWLARLHGFPLYGRASRKPPERGDG